MKSNQIIQRPMGAFSVQQRTKDGMFNATALLNQWNASTNSKKELKDYMDNKSTKEFIIALTEEENLHGEKSPYVKSKARADRGGGTWMHPLMFMDFAMWLNPAFKVKVLKFASDQMIKYRNDAGDAYKELSAAVYTLVDKDFMPVAISKVSQAINYIVFGNHQKEIRNSMGEETLQRELFEMERKVAELINEGFLTSYDEVLNYLRKKWYEKYEPKFFLPKTSKD